VPAAIQTEVLDKVQRKNLTDEDEDMTEEQANGPQPKEEKLGPGESYLNLYVTVGLTRADNEGRAAMHTLITGNAEKALQDQTLVRDKYKCVTVVTSHHTTVATCHTCAKQETAQPSERELSYARMWGELQEEVEKRRDHILDLEKGEEDGLAQQSLTWVLELMTTMQVDRKHNQDWDEAVLRNCQHSWHIDDARDTPACPGCDAEA